MNAGAESLTTKLSLAIRLVDDYTKEQPVGAVSVSLKDQKYEAIKNPSEYYLFLDLPGEDYTVQVRSDFYFDETLDVHLSSLDPRNPSKDILLKPKPTYPFPNGATLIRGTVADQNKKLVSDATVEFSEKNLKTSTSKNGEFVLYFPPLKDKDVIKEKDKRFVKTKTGKSILVEAASNNYSGKTTLDSLEEGTSKTVAIVLNISS
jgi:hypothetical protein